MFGIDSCAPWSNAIVIATDRPPCPSAPPRTALGFPAKLVLGVFIDGFRQIVTAIGCGILVTKASY